MVKGIHAPLNFIRRRIFHNPNPFWFSSKASLSGTIKLRVRKLSGHKLSVVLAQCGPSSFADIAAIDTNCDKFAEMSAAYPKLAKYDFDEMDLNGDNHVSSVERLAPHAQCILGEH